MAVLDSQGSARYGWDVSGPDRQSRNAKASQGVARNGSAVGESHVKAMNREERQSRNVMARQRLARLRSVRTGSLGSLGQGLAGYVVVWNGSQGSSGLCLVGYGMAVMDGFGWLGKRLDG